VGAQPLSAKQRAGKVVWGARYSAVLHLRPKPSENLIFRVWTDTDRRTVSCCCRDSLPCRRGYPSNPIRLPHYELEDTFIQIFARL
jgi:hypothetical protein